MHIHAGTLSWARKNARAMVSCPVSSQATADVMKNIEDRTEETVCAFLSGMLYRCAVFFRNTQGECTYMKPLVFGLLLTCLAMAPTDADSTEGRQKVLIIYYS
jgi:hypothetical protein